MGPVHASFSDSQVFHIELESDQAQPLLVAALSVSGLGRAVVFTMSSVFLLPCGAWRYTDPNSNEFGSLNKEPCPFGLEYITSNYVKELVKSSAS